MREDNWDWRTLSHLRDEVKVIDFKLLELISDRMTICGRIGKIKAANRQPVYDPLQEEKVIATRVELGKELGLENEFVKKLMALLMDYSKKIQLNEATVCITANAPAHTSDDEEIQKI